MMFKEGDLVKVIKNVDYAHKPSSHPYVLLKPNDIIKILELQDQWIIYYVDEDWKFTNKINKHYVEPFKPCKCKIILKKLNNCLCEFDL